MFVLECGLGIIYVGSIPIKIFNKTSACAVLFLPSVCLDVKWSHWICCLQQFKQCHFWKMVLKKIQNAGCKQSTAKIRCHVCGTRVWLQPVWNLQKYLEFDRLTPWMLGNFLKIYYIVVCFSIPLKSAQFWQGMILWVANRLDLRPAAELLGGWPGSNLFA